MTIEANPGGTNKDIIPNEQSFNQKKHWLDYVTFGLELFGLIVLCVYAAYTIKIYYANQKAADAAQRTLGEVQKQTTLTRQQLVGTMSAVLTFEPRITNDPLTATEVVLVQLLNQGHVIAPEAHATVQIETISFPNLNKLLESQTYTVVAQQVGPGAGWSRQYPLQDFAQPERQFATQRKTITVKGTFWFDNGFGDKFEQPICFTYIGNYHFKTEEGGSTSGPMVLCRARELQNWFPIS